MKMRPYRLRQVEREPIKLFRDGRQHATRSSLPLVLLGSICASCTSPSTEGVDSGSGTASTSTATAPTAPPATSEPTTLGSAERPPKRARPAPVAIGDEYGGDLGPRKAYDHVKPRTVPNDTRCSKGMSYIPGGLFSMGSSDSEGKPDERPERRVKLDSFCIDPGEVTYARYEQCIREAHGDLKCRSLTDPEVFCPSVENPALTPIACAKWADADLFCRWGGGRLPTEAGWEYVARGGAEQRTYPWGSAPPDGRVCWGGCPIGAYPKGDARWGVYDMAWGVLEWTSDWYAPYEPSSEVVLNPLQGTPKDKQDRVIRGASARAAKRYFADPDRRLSNVGFRCVQSPKK